MNLLKFLKTMGEKGYCVKNIFYLILDFTLLKIP